jgi:hypothetical protein
MSGPLGWEWSQRVDLLADPHSRRCKHGRLVPTRLHVQMRGTSTDMFCIDVACEETTALQMEMGLT